MEDEGEGGRLEFKLSVWPEGARSPWRARLDPEGGAGFEFESPLELARFLTGLEAGAEPRRRGLR